eukprot:TRINITY_DN59453_c0_g1_i1.p1 TRINITY_DN59453_c0_g1~~TRINITY_DN59453_c0_g1_i1.p1  ORF type:complete len:405 (+),score=95.57 TRINITY_DN59453_c0_g1_i1:66-1280(+)
MTPYATRERRLASSEGSGFPEEVLQPVYGSLGLRSLNSLRAVTSRARRPVTQYLQERTLEPLRRSLAAIVGREQPEPKRSLDGAFRALEQYLGGTATAGELAEKLLSDGLAGEAGSFCSWSIEQQAAYADEVVRWWLSSPDQRKAATAWKLPLAADLIASIFAAQKEAGELRHDEPGLDLLLDGPADYFSPYPGQTQQDRLQRTEVLFNSGLYIHLSACIADGALGECSALVDSFHSMLFVGARSFLETVDEDCRAVVQSLDGDALSSSQSALAAAVREDGLLWKLPPEKLWRACLTAHGLLAIQSPWAAPSRAPGGALKQREESEQLRRALALLAVCAKHAGPRQLVQLRSDSGGWWPSPLVSELDDAFHAVDSVADQMWRCEEAYKAWRFCPGYNMSGFQRR